MQEKVEDKIVRRNFQVSFPSIEYPTDVVESFRQAFGHKQYVAGDFEFKSTWWKHPHRNSNGSLRAKPVVKLNEPDYRTLTLFKRSYTLLPRGY